MMEAPRLLFVAVGSRLSQSLVIGMWIVPPAGAYCGAAGTPVPTDPEGDTAAGAPPPQATVSKHRITVKALSGFATRMYKSPPLHHVCLVWCDRSLRTQIGLIRRG